MDDTFQLKQRPDFSNASILERPFTSLLSKLDDADLVWVRDYVGQTLGKMVVVLFMALLVFDLARGEITNPVIVAIGFAEWYACALGATCRAHWPYETQPDIDNDEIEIDE